MYSSAIRSASAPKRNQLVTSGLYSRFRHPVYLFGTLAYAGVVIAWGRPTGYILLAGATAFATMANPERRRCAGPRVRRRLSELQNGHVALGLPWTCGYKPRCSIVGFSTTACPP